VARPARDGDIDGDGRVDHVTIGPQTSSGVWQVTATLTTVGVRIGQVHDDSDQPFLVGIVDANHDGYAEIWIHSGAGASTDFLTPLRLIRGVLREVSKDGSPAQLGVGGTVTHGDGFACQDVNPQSDGAELLVYQATSIDGHTWQGDRYVYRWSAGGKLRQLSHTSKALRVSSPDDPKLRPYYSIDCGSLGQ